MQRIRVWVFLIAAIAFICLSTTPAVAQSLTTGDIVGTVTDPSGAVIPAANVALKSIDTGASQTASTNEGGEFRFRLLNPGRYSVTVALTGFQTTTRPVSVNVGQIVTANLVLAVGSTTQVIEVSGAAPLLNPEASMNTPYTPQEIAQLPVAGGDLTNMAFTAPGVVVNNTGGYGNFTVNGLPATSNLFTINGENNMDPYFNINNSGASNLSIGANEIQEATIVANPYAGQYGQLAGAQVNYVTKSGTNEFHGNAQYLWNGRAMNSNNWFNNAYGDPRPFSNANQWAAAVGGPIKKNKLFFFANTEGLRFVLPNVISTTIPTPEFANAVVANVQAKQPAEADMYKRMMDLYLNAPGAQGANVMANSSYCKGLTLAGFDPTTQHCAARFNATPNALGSEWILTGKVDYNVSDNDQASFRYKSDRGTQPTSLDPISPAFNAISNQPSWDTQFHETHIFGPRSTNEFLATLSHYTALFQQDHEAAAKAFPYDVVNSGAVPFTTLNNMRNFPQGRNITQYQFIDNITYTTGKHSLKFGENFRRYDVSDHNFYLNNPVAYFGYTADGLQKFANGIGYQYRMRDNASSNVPVAMWGLGVYAQDEWAVRPNLKLTLTLRAERNSNPVCQTNCFANLKGPWNSLASVTNADPGSVPYSADIIANQHRAYPGVDKINLMPRVGFSWSPRANNRTVISGGFGIFYDNPAAGMVDNLLSNPPVVVDIRVRPRAGVLPFDPTGGAATWTASAAAFDMNKTYGQLSSELSALGSVFSAPGITAISGTIHAPQWQEWNLQIQRQLTNSTALTVNYVGNHGIHIPYSTAWNNAFDLYGIYPGVAGVPEAPKVSNYSTVTTIQSGAISNYNGLTATFTKRFSHSFSAHFNYTWSHNLDESSNGGLFTYGDSLFGQINPSSLRAANYGNSDYDIRHNFNADWVVNPNFNIGNRILKSVVNGWQWSGRWYWRSGLPFSIYDDNWVLGNGGGSILGTPVGGAGQTGSCGPSAVTTPCLNAGAFLNSASDSFMGYTGWSPQTRNQFRGPRYFNVDMNLFRNFKVMERLNFAIGAQAFNVFNHPNFANPDNYLSSSTFGTIYTMQNAPTSPYGTFLGFDSSVRVVQLSAKVTF